MEGMELISFEIISNVGGARSCYVEAIGLAKNGDAKAAMDMISEGEALFVNGHRAHAKLVQEEAAGNPVVPNLLLIHAEDQLMSAETFKIVALEFISLYEMMNSNTK
ncbi:PTS lactose/cellobiose transporter subunit IIA [[Clostridium] dakarense]|uniref:PTS lactose/cellobiose transporter subunit IIA n=1 Tax=Faecalimicrobium dakarense TaxID=1301100 RepID=UPI0004ADAFC3|nr:PTS lactose/cellobiose transporter subunit IIA [[Clostridium] dakarense]